MSDAAPSWVQAVLGAVPRSQILHPGVDSPVPSSRRMVDIVCAECGERLGVVTDEAVDSGGPRLTVWAPPIGLDGRRPGEKHWSVMTGMLPETEPLIVHCFQHSTEVVQALDLRSAISRYREKGRPQRLLAGSRVQR